MIAVVSTQNMLSQAVNGQNEEDFNVIRSGGGWRARGSWSAVVLESGPEHDGLFRGRGWDGVGGRGGVEQVKRVTGEGQIVSSWLGDLFTSPLSQAPSCSVSKPGYRPRLLSLSPLIGPPGG